MTQKEELISNIEKGTNYGPYKWNREDSVTMLSDEKLMSISELHANLMLNRKNKSRWDELHRVII